MDEGHWEKNFFFDNTIEIFSQEEVGRIVARKRESLVREIGCSDPPVTHFRRPVELPFTKEQREHTTFLFGGFSRKHERFIHGAWKSLGYRADLLPTPGIEAFQLGKEFCDIGLCSPAYFTIGSLLQYLRTLEQQGLTRAEIIDRYVFLIAGSCGPCRFGMYEAEYRLALRNAGYDGFRVITFQQKYGLHQSDTEAGIEMNFDFFLGLLNAMILGDLLNDVAYQIRPYEVHPGQTNKVLEQCVKEILEALEKRKPFEFSGGVGDFLRKFPQAHQRVSYMAKWLHQLCGRSYVEALCQAKEQLDKIEVDRTKPKPIVKITGEFWAQTTEGDGNYRMFSFLEEEGAQVLIEPLGTWIMYLLHQEKQASVVRQGLPSKCNGRDVVGSDFSPWDRFCSVLENRRRRFVLTLAEMFFEREWNRLRKPFNFVPGSLTDQYELRRLSDPYYDFRAEGGEGHLEIAKSIWCTTRKRSHMVLSLKPFGCMPSTQSDGAQSAVVGVYKDLIYLPIETDGEGEIHAYSRVQMALREAKIRAREEFEHELNGCKHSLEQIQRFVAEHPPLRRGLCFIPRSEGVVGLAANYVRYVDTLMSKKGNSILREKMRKYLVRQ